MRSSAGFAIMKPTLMVMMPSRPKNMRTIRTICDAALSAGVMPVVRPTVHRAEMVS